LSFGLEKYGFGKRIVSGETTVQGLRSKVGRFERCAFIAGRDACAPVVTLSLAAMSDSLLRLNAGSLYDATGNLKMWWTPDDRKSFEEKADCVVGQFDGYEVEKGLFLNGKYTLGGSLRLADPGL
jgi:hypothetical protein